jgi:hypothetical protein
MNYTKTGAALASALDHVTNPSARTLSVFVRTNRDPEPAEMDLLEAAGVNGVAPGRQVFTATLSAQEIDQLSEQSWVRSLELSRPLRLLGSTRTFHR